MHAVIRKRQGIPWTKEEPKSMQSNLAHLVDVSVRAGPFPVDDLALAFSAGAYPKLVAQITAPTLSLRQKALEYVLGLCSAPREIASFLSAGLVTGLNAAACDEEASVRILATAVLARLAREQAGRTALLESISVLIKLVCDLEEEVRANTLEAVVQLAKGASGANALIEADCVQLLVARCAEEGKGLQAAVAAALKQCMLRAEGLGNAIDAGGIAAAVDLLSEETTEAAREHACYCLGALSVGNREKVAAIKLNALDRLIALMDDDRATRAEMTAATSALMSLTVDNDGKMEATRLGAVKVVGTLLLSSLATEQSEGHNSDNAALTANSMQCATNLAEFPKARAQLQVYLEAVRPLIDSAEPLVRKHAKKCVAQIEWNP